MPIMVCPLWCNSESIRLMRSYPGDPTRDFLSHPSIIIPTGDPRSRDLRPPGTGIYLKGEGNEVAATGDR